MSAVSRLAAIVLVMIVQGALSAPAQAMTTAERLSQIPAPFDARVLSVGNNLNHNGQRMSLATFDSSLSVSDTAAFYRELWSRQQDDDTPGLVENRAGQWLIISQLQDGYQNVLQLNTEIPHKSEGFLSVMKLESRSRGALPDTDLPGMNRLSTTHSQDADRVSQLSVYQSTEGVEPLARQLAELWQGRGWTLVSSEPYAHSRVLLLNRKSAQLEVVLSQSSGEGTLVVVNEVDDD